MKGYPEPVAVFSVHPAARTERPTERPLFGRYGLLEAVEPVFRPEAEVRLALLYGDAGAGKTAVVRHLAQRRGGAFHVDGDPLQLGAPYGALRRGLEQVLGAARDAAIDRMRERHPDLAERAALLNDVLECHAPETQATAELQDFLRGEATVALIVELVRREVRETELIVVDDAQWLDASSAEVVRALYEGLPTAPMIVAARVGGALPEALQSLMDEGFAVRHEVAPLDRAGTLELMRHTVRDEPDDQLVDWVFDRTGGQPLFVIETARTLRAAGADVFDAAALESLSPPPTVEGALAWRIDRLDEAARVGLKAASVLGVEFHPKLLQAVHPLGPDGGEVARQLQEMARHELCQPARNGRYQFVLPLAREVAYASMLQEQRHAIHLAAAAQLVEIDASPARIAHHFIQGGEAARALEPLQAAAQLANRSGAVAETHRFLTEAVDLDRKLRDRGEGVPLSERGSWLRRLADCAAALGRPEEARDHAISALRALGGAVPRTEPEWRNLAFKQLLVHLSHRVLPDVFWRQGPEGLTEARERAGAYTRLSEAHFFLAGSRMALLGSTLAAVNEAERCLAPATATSAIGTMAMVANTLGLQRAAEHYLATTVIGATTSGPRDVAVAWFVHVMVYAPRGEWAKAEEASAKALPLLRASQNRFMIGPVLSVNAINETLRGRYDAAEPWAEELTRYKGIDRYRAWGDYNLANIALLRGDAEVARDLAARSRDLLVATNDVSRITADGLLAVAQARCGNGEAARESALELLDRLQQDPMSSYTRLEGYAAPAEVYADLMEAAAANGRDPSAADRDGAKRALAALKRFAKRYVLGGTRLSLLRGRIEAAQGRTGRARRSLTRALELAREMGLPADEGRALTALARLEPDAAFAHLDQAEAIFGQLGCVGFLREAQQSRLALSEGDRA